MVKKKWLRGKIVKVLSSVTYLIKIDEDIKFMHADSLRPCELNNQSTGNLFDSTINDADNSKNCVDIFKSPERKITNDVPCAIQEDTSKIEKEESEVVLTERAQERANTPIVDNPVEEQSTPGVRRSIRIRKQPVRLDL